MRRHRSFPHRPGSHLFSATTLNLRRYCLPTVLALDEVGYLSYDNRHADLLFEVVTRRYGKKSTLIATNKAFAEWNEV
ncbi:MAG: ATP-binding protein, partial [bacterium]